MRNYRQRDCPEDLSVVIVTSTAHKQVISQLTIKNKGSKKAPLCLSIGLNPRISIRLFLSLSNMLCRGHSLISIMLCLSISNSFYLCIRPSLCSSFYLYNPACNAQTRLSCAT